MNILGEECQADLLTYLRIIGRVNLELTALRRERNPINAFFHIFRIKIIIDINLHALLFIAQLPALRVRPMSSGPYQVPVTL